MNSFEKLAAQYEAAGKIICIPEIEKALTKATKNGASDAMRYGMIFQGMAAALRKEPDAVRQLIAMEKEIDVEAVDGLPEGDLSKTASAVFLQVVAPFFGSASGQDAEK